MGAVETDLRNLAVRNEVMAKTYRDLTEHQYLLKNLLNLMDKPSQEETLESMVSEESRLIEEGGAPSADGKTLRTIGGVIEMDKLESLTRLSFRISRGNAIVRYSEPNHFKEQPNAPRKSADDDTPEGEADVGSVAFIIFFSGSVLQDKLSKLVMTLGGRRYRVPDSGGSTRLAEEVRQSLDEHINVMKAAQRTETSLLRPYAEFLPGLERRVRERLAIFHTMNRFNYAVSSQAAVAEAWIPTARLKDDVQRAVQEASVRAGAGTPTIINVLRPPPGRTPPTFIRTNVLTAAFQGLNDAYGTPSYRELNPGIFYPVTYSFLFGIMFGDIGHGLLLLISAAFLVAFERQLGREKLNELLQPAYEGRYLLLLMGVFSVYCGLMYNECFGRPLLPWSFYAISCAEGARACDALPAGVAPVGVDPIWGIAENKLAYVNSLKMKLSILLGVAHMTFGLACKTANCLYFRRWKDLWFENVAEFLFLWALFGYLSILIVLKWCTDWVGLALRPPSLLDTLLHMLLSPGAAIPEDAQMYPGQGPVQAALVGVALVCVPWMLLIKPLLLAREHRAGYEAIPDAAAAGGEAGADKAGSDKAHVAAGGHGDGDGHGHGDGEFDLQEVFIHQMIHTIEFVLG